MTEEEKQGLETPVKIFIVIACLIIAVPFVYIWVLSVPATKVLINMEDTTKSDMTIKVIGSQWRWQYEYLGTDISFYSTNEDHRPTEANEMAVSKALVVPSGRKVRVLITASDVIHAWWIPAFGVKKDAIPGYINELWFQVDEGKEGTYVGGCAELCGDGHYNMPIEVSVMTGSEFDAWIAAGGYKN